MLIDDDHASDDACMTVAKRRSSRRSIRTAHHTVFVLLWQSVFAYYESDIIDEHSEPSDGPFNSSDAYGYILLMY